MATKLQYDVLKAVHDEENARLTELVTRAKVYLSVATFFIATLFFKIEAVFVHGDCVGLVRAAYASSIGLFFLSVLAAVLSLRILPYERPWDLEEIAKAFAEAPQKRSVFLDARLADLAVATERNSKQNDKRADCLIWAGRFMIAGFAASLCWGAASVI